MEKGNGVTRKEFYDEFLEARRESGMQYQAIAEFMGRIDACIAAHDKRLDVHRGALDDLDKKVDDANSRDKWWNGVNSFAIAVAAAFGFTQR